VKFEVYNLLGERIDNRSLGLLGAAEHYIKWVAIENPSGTYFYKIRTKDFSYSGKMLLIR
jgi:hypothetical protein